ncbi:MAG: tetratricopeptide repeat protein, partial [Gemmatimonadetes bacterium]|nr:tetratricopeptide repeat protein [Gemmatimonadota bacterium]
NPEVAVTDTQTLPEPTRAEPVETAPTIRVTNTVAPAAGTPKDDVSARLASVRRALTQGDFRGAHALIENAMTDFAADADARRNVQLWTGILAFEEGRLDEALATFRGLDASASYEASGFGAGTVANWEARVLLAQGDVRGAIAALDGVGADDPNEYAAARLWEGMALASLGMTELAERTWERLPSDMGSRVSGAGQGAVKSAEFLAGAIADKDYRTAVSSIDGYQNDMYFFLGWRARQEKQLDVARDNYRKVLDSSRGHEFPFDLARSEIDGKGLGGEWPAE